jgi:hypothetical protein
MKIKTALLIAALAALPFTSRVCADAAPEQASATLAGDAARPGSAHWLRSELYFSVAPVDSVDNDVAEMRWRGFLEKEVTSRFPDGLTVFDAYGQWRDRGRDAPSRLWTKVLVILHEDTPANRAAIDAIRVAWKASTHHKSVLLVTMPADVSF